MRTPPSNLLRSVSAPPSSSGYDVAGLRTLLSEAREVGATDLHFKVPGVPRFRVNGALVPTQRGRLSPADTRRLAQTVLELAHREEPLATLTDLQVGFGVAREGRFRAQVYRQRGTLGVVIHRMELTPPSLEDLGGDGRFAEMAWSAPGLLVVTGRKDRLRTLAGLVDAYNRREMGHLLCLEAPLEYLHRDDRASVAQREVGVDVHSIAAGLEIAVFDDSDAVCVSDLPDAQSVELAVRIAEAGRPVVAGVAGCEPAHVVRHLLRRFPVQREREMIERLSNVVRRVVWSEDDALCHGFPGGR